MTSVSGDPKGSPNVPLTERVHPDGFSRAAG
jgi:hypothetical protein